VLIDEEHGATLAESARIIEFLETTYGEHAVDGDEEVEKAISKAKEKAKSET
jgi:glutathione S-transferase